MPQNCKNHVRFVPPFHFFVLPMLLLNVIWQLIQWIRHFSAGSVIAFFTAVALLGLALFARMFAVTVQDRVIRLEMRLRMHQLLPPDLRSRILDFTPSQLIGMRFAGDAELPGLARKVLDEKIMDRAAIKRLVKDWQADYLRA